MNLQNKLNAIHCYNAATGQMPTVSTSSFNSHWCVCELLVCDINDVVDEETDSGVPFRSP